MIVVMKPGSTQRQIDHMIERIEELGLRSHVIVGTDRTVIAALGEKRDGAKQALETGEGVEKVVPILAPYKMASTEVKKERTVVQARNLKVGNCHVGVIAGPCSVESRDQILAGNWWLAVFPGLAIMITALAFNLVGDWLRDYLDPRLQD